MPLQRATPCTEQVSRRGLKPASDQLTGSSVSPSLSRTLWLLLQRLGRSSAQRLALSEALGPDQTREDSRMNAQLPMDFLNAARVYDRPLIVDSFAGGGGASTGIEQALGRSPDIAINHDPAALALHEANHPDTMHLSENVYRIDPLDHLNGKHIGLMWFSPDCKHFSKAKGGKPVARNIRDLAWIIPGWIERIQKSCGKVDVVMMENFLDLWHSKINVLL